VEVCASRGDTMALPLRVGVVGCGLIAQVMHLPHLAELTDDYEIAALCDVSEPVAAALPSPYLRNVLSLLTIETGQDGTPFAARTVEVVSYQEAFKRELVELAAAIETGRAPRIDVRDGLHDVALCHAIARAHAHCDAHSLAECACR
jgi:predicted dehydrogenase